MIMHFLMLIYKNKERFDSINSFQEHQLQKIFDLVANEYYVNMKAERGRISQDLKGEDIPLLSRFNPIVDSYGVMTNERSYKSVISKNF